MGNSKQYTPPSASAGPTLRARPDPRLPATIRSVPYVREAPILRPVALQWHFTEQPNRECGRLERVS